MAGGGSRKAIVAALVANIGIAVSKFVAFLLTGSASMLAEATHSVADAGNQGLLLLGEHRAKRKATPERPFGSARESYFAAFIVSIVLFTAGAGFAFREGFHKLSHPEAIDSPFIAIGVLVAAIIMEIFSFRTAIQAAQPLRNGRSWWRFIRESKAAELNVVLLEDLAALLGLVLALGGVSIAAAADAPRWDAYGTLSIAALLAVIAIVLAIETKSLLIGESAGPDTEGMILAELRAQALFQSVVYLRTEQRSGAEILVAAKVAVDPALDAGVLATAIDETEARIRAAVPSATYIFIEPDIAK